MQRSAIEEHSVHCSINSRISVDDSAKHALCFCLTAFKRERADRCKCSPKMSATAVRPGHVCMSRCRPLSPPIARYGFDLIREPGRSAISAVGQQRSKSTKDDPLWRVLQATQGRRHVPTVSRSFRWCRPVPGSGGHRLARKFNQRLLVWRTPLVGQRRLNQPLLDGLDLQSEESRVDAHVR